MNFWATLAVTLVALATATIVGLAASGGSEALYFEGTYLGSPASLWVNSTSGTGKLAITAEGVSYILVSAGLEPYTVYTTDPVSCEYEVGSMGFVPSEPFFSEGGFSFEVYQGESMVFGTPVAAGSDSIPVPTISECGAARARAMAARGLAQAKALDERELNAGISARDLWQLTRASYGASRRELGGSPNPQGKNPPSGWTIVSTLEERNTQGKIFKKGNQYVAGFAGTDGANIFDPQVFKDWVDNLDLGSVCIEYEDYQDCQTIRGACRQTCHRCGWRGWGRCCSTHCDPDRRVCTTKTRCKAGKTVYRGSHTYMDRLEDEFNDAGYTYDYVVGHSLGGGAATIYTKKNPTKSKYGVVSFGAPPTGGDSHCSVPGYRFFDNSDPISGSVGLFNSFSHDVTNAVKCGEPTLGRNWWTLGIMARKGPYQCSGPGSFGTGHWSCQDGSEWGCDWWTLGINCLLNFAGTHTEYHNHVTAYSPLI